MTDFLVSQLSAPNVGEFVVGYPPIVALGSTVLNACIIMKQQGSTAVMVLENQSSLIAGILYALNKRHIYEQGFGPESFGSWP